MAARIAVMAPVNLHHLELFYYVCRHGGISRAVRHMPYGIQQPAVSSQILALEQDLGAKLFERQPFRLTAEGQELYEFARPFFDNADAVAERIRKRNAPKLRIAASEIVLRDHLPEVIKGIRKKFPDLRLALRNGYQTEVEAWLQAGECDFGITTMDSQPRAGLKYLSITKLPIVLLVPKSSPLKSATELWARDSIDEPLICLPAGESLTKCFYRGLKQLRVEWPTTIDASSIGLVTRYVANGYGIGVTVGLADLVRHPKLKTLPLPGFDPIEIAALWRPPLNPVQEILRAAVEQRARELWPAE